MSIPKSEAPKTEKVDIHGTMTTEAKPVAKPDSRPTTLPALGSHPIAPVKKTASVAPPKPASLEDQMDFHHREIARAEKRVVRVKEELDAVIRKHNAAQRT